MRNFAMRIDEFCRAEPLCKPVDSKCLAEAMTAFLEVWNMNCPYCAIWVRNSLLKLDGVLIVDVFVKQGIAAATYDPKYISVDDLLRTVIEVGQDCQRYYSAELIGQEPAAQALHLQP